MPVRVYRCSLLKAAFGIALLFGVSALSLAPKAFGQALPTAEAAPPSTGFSLPRAAGSLSFGAGANESISTGYYGSGYGVYTGFNADVAYLSGSQRAPFSMVFSGGKSFSNNGGTSPYYLNLGVSQVLNTHLVTFTVSDGLSYLPQTATTGLSGIPGVGDLGVSPIQTGIDTGQGVLTNYASRITEGVNVGAAVHVTGRTSLNLGGSYSTLLFLGNTNNGGLSDTGESGSVGVSHTISARTSAGGSFGYSRYTYGGNLPGFESETASLNLSHQFSRTLSGSISIGPQRTSQFDTLQPVPSSVGLFASASAAYSTNVYHAALSYSQGTNNGSGAVAGATSDSVSLSIGRVFAHVWNASASSSFTRTTGLNSVGADANFRPQTFVVSGQLSRALGRNLSAFASYTLEHQSVAGSAAAPLTYNGFIKVASFGINFAPPALHLGSR